MLKSISPVLNACPSPGFCSCWTEFQRCSWSLWWEEWFEEVVLWGRKGETTTEKRRKWFRRPSMEQNNSKRLYRLVKDLTAENQARSTTIQNKPEICLTEEQDILSRWTEYCPELYNHETVATMQFWAAISTQKIISPLRGSWDCNCSLKTGDDNIQILCKQAERLWQGVKQDLTAWFKG